MAGTTKQDLEEPTFWFTEAVDVKDNLHEIYFGNSGERHEKQLRLLEDVLTVATVDPNAFRKYVYNGSKRCLFNILVALEWSPSPETAQALKQTFADAAQLLMDVTDGYMSIGSVTVGGPELMPCADIQIFASNRLFPRSSVNGLNDELKYQPIRLGRGLWSKNSRSTISWDERKGVATIVHEWGHYALGLKDQYIKLENDLVIPDRSIVKDTIMASLDKSELLSSHTNDQSTDASEWEALRLHPRYKWLDIKAPQTPNAAPPPQVVVPAFSLIGAAAGEPRELPFTLDGASAVDPGSCWVYVVKGSLETPTGLIAQGSFERTGDFKLFGAEIDDFVVLIGGKRGAPAEPIVLYAQIKPDTAGNPTIDSWKDATPESYPQIDVIATNADTVPPFDVRITGFDASTWNAVLFPLGRKPLGANSPVNGLDVLDGHVMLISAREGATNKLAIACYAQGGSPFSGYPAHPNPIPAGSADGNAMIFFFDASIQNFKYANIYPVAAEGPKFNASKLITTTNLLNNTNPPAGWQPRSYTFSITNYGSLAEVEHMHPTLILYFDQDTLKDADGDLVIGRYDSTKGNWGQVKTEIKPQEFIAAASLSDSTAHGLFQSPPVPEHYRLFLVPKSEASGNP